MQNKSEFNCIVCGKLFLRWPSQVPGVNGRKCFCSAKCQNSINKAPDTICEYCGKPARSYRSSPRRFCSKTCYLANKQQFLEKQCQRCGKTFSVKKSRANALYCSSACAWSNAVHLNCKRCGKLFRETRNGRKYCSEACRRPVITIHCTNCNKEFRVSPHRTKRINNYCSVHCYRAYTGDSSLEVACDQVLQELGVTFNRQVACGQYTIDFVLSGNIALEVDGWYWHRDVAKERRRDTFLIKKGYKVIHYRWEGYETIVALVRTQLTELLESQGIISNQTRPRGVLVAPNQYQLQLW